MHTWTCTTHAYMDMYHTCIHGHVPHIHTCTCTTHTYMYHTDTTGTHTHTHTHTHVMRARRIAHAYDRPSALHTHTHTHMHDYPPHHKHTVTISNSMGSFIGAYFQVERNQSSDLVGSVHGTVLMLISHLKATVSLATGQQSGMCGLNI